MDCLIAPTTIISEVGLLRMLWNGSIEVIGGTYCFHARLLILLQFHNLFIFERVTNVTLRWVNELTDNDLETCFCFKTHFCSLNLI